mmetsp:Transcript_108362/g.169443  ORF Transcript_108362/g.169443 Transcript_108362/m.169443 type:complete len:384 (+) Transcript_108362:65-1216(+)
MRNCAITLACLSYGCAQIAGLSWQSSFREEPIGMQALATVLLASPSHYGSPILQHTGARRHGAASMQDISETVASAPDKSAEEIRNKEVATGHKMKAPVDIDPEEMKIMQTLQAHQAEANKQKLSIPDEVRTLVEYNHGYAVISTNSKQFPGTPTGSVVGFAPDENGSPLFCFSGMSTHTQDLMKDPRCSLTVAAKEFKGAQDGRVNLIGECVPVKGKEEKAKATEIYMKKHPGAFWATFGDFTWYRMKVENVRTVGGFARAGFINGEQYASGKPDVISAIQERVAGHMNGDHRDATIAMVKHYVGIDVEDAEITSMDRLGMYVKVTRTPIGKTESQSAKIRLPYARPVDDPKNIKAMIIEMTRMSAPPQPEAEEAKAEVAEQ